MAVKSLEVNNPIKTMELFNSASKDYEASITENQKSRQALNAELDKKPGSGREQEIRRQLQSIDAADSSAKNAFTLNRNVIAKALNLPVDAPALQVPTIHVGDGVTDAGSSSSTSSASKPDIDPRSGKPWSSSTSAVDRAIISAHYGGTVLANKIEDDINGVNQGVKSIKRFFDTQTDSRQPD